MYRNNKLIVLFIALIGSLSLTSVQALAASGTMEEIVVTATKREQSIQDVPIAVSAFSGEDMEARGVVDMYGLQEISPSISVYSSNSTSNGGTIRIRGVGTTGNNPGLEAAVGTFIDGVYRSRAGQAFSDFVDIERIEVLRGPQGTLFGKNTSAGALHIITKRPEFEQDGMLLLSAGDYDALRLQGAYTNALIENQLAFRISGNYHERDGYYEDDSSGDAFDGRDRWGVNTQFLWTPSDSFENLVIIDYSERTEDCCPAKSEFMNRTLQGQSSTSRGALSNGLPPGVVVDMLIEELGKPAVIPDFSDKTTVGLNFKPFEEVEDWGIQNQASWEINDDMTLVSITAYREYDVQRGQDIDFTAADIVEPQSTTESFENFSQEFQLTFSTDNADYLFGAYFYTEDIKTDESIRLSAQGAKYLSIIQTGLIDQALGLPLGTFQTSPLIPQTNTVRGTALGSFDPVTRELVSDGTLRANHAPGDGYYADFTQETSGWSVFTHNVFHLTDRMDLTVGLRYTNEKKEALTSINGTAPTDATSERDLALQLSGNLTNEDHCTGLAAVGALCNNASWEDENTEKEWTGTVKLGYALTDEMNVYVSYSRGYKAGGFNLDQSAIEVDVFGTSLATGGLPVFLGGPHGLPEDIPQSVIDDPRTDDEGRYGLQDFECGSLGGIVSQTPENIDCLVLDDDHAFDPEFVDAYEIGIKARFFDGALTTNVAFFYSDFEDFQLNTFTGTGFLISNTDEMISKGVELESMWDISEGIQFTFGVTYADARYGDDLNMKGVDEESLFLAQDYETLEDWGALENIESRQITQSPYWQGSASLYLEHGLGQNFIGYSNINYAYRGGHNTGSDLKAAKEVSGEAIVNLQLGLRPQEGRWDLQLWARNLTDNHVKTLVFNSVFQSGSFSTFFGAPRMVGLTLKTSL